jgi:transposase-like protein
MELQCMKQPALDPGLMICPYCQEEERIGVHSIGERRYRCHACEGTFSETKGTIFYGLHYPIWLVTLVMTLLSYGCPPAAAVAAFFLDERTVAAWHRKAGRHGKQVQETQVCQGSVEPGQVQADELCVTTQRGKVWMATAMSVFSRLFLWGEVSAHRDRSLIERVMQKVRQAAGSIPQVVLFAVDGFSAIPKRSSKSSTLRSTPVNGDVPVIFLGPTRTSSRWSKVGADESSRRSFVGWCMGHPTGSTR